MWLNTIKINMKISYPINYAGYFPIQRSILKLVSRRIIPLSQLGSYICFVSQADFDPRHRYYRTVLRDDSQIAAEFGINSTTIYRHRKDLIKAGLLAEEDEVTKITNYRMFELEWVQKLAKRSIINPEQLFLAAHDMTASFEDLIANLQKGQDQIATQSSNSNVSFKGNKFKDSLWLDGQNY